MAKNLNPDVEEQKNSEYNRPVELYQIFLDEETLYFAMYPEDIDYYDENGNTQTYYAAAISRNPVSKNNETSPDSTTIQLDNVMREWSAYVANTDIVGREVSIWKVFLDADLNTSDNHIAIFTRGIIDTVSIDDQNLVATIVSNLDTLDIDLPRRTYQVKCDWPNGFGGDGCGVDVPELSGIIEDIDNKLIFNGNITEENDYWKYGIIKVNNESREIVGSGDGYIELEFQLFNADIGDEFEIMAGCDFSYDGGHGCEFWNNTERYGGFLDIPKIRNIREV